MTVLNTGQSLINMKNYKTLSRNTWKECPENST
uniref:Uncharacterized protein n=1 Tax=Musa acuminata subsp. malaccensis TaxID=214687 RepID=A0A804JQE4_MUSAM